MDLHPREGVKPISDFRKDSAKILKDLKSSHAPILLTQRGRSVAVLLDIDTYERMEYDAQLRASYARGVDDLRHGRARSQADIAKEVEQRKRRLSRPKSD